MYNNTIENELIEEIQNNIEFGNEKDLFYNLEIIESTIYVSDIKFRTVYLMGIIICDSNGANISSFITPYIFSFSNQINDYVMIENFPSYEIDEELDTYGKDIEMKGLKFEQLISYFKEIKKIDVSKIGIEDKDDLTHCD